VSRPAPPPPAFPYTTLFRPPRSGRLGVDLGPQRPDDPDPGLPDRGPDRGERRSDRARPAVPRRAGRGGAVAGRTARPAGPRHVRDRKSTRLNSSHAKISYAV